MARKKEKLISLKEAAGISGYAPDYIGQLIRKGKLKGRQVYVNVAWMTTENDIQNYMDKIRKNPGEEGWSENLSNKLTEFRAKLALESHVARILKTFLYLTIAVCVGFCLFLFYVISTNIDKKIEQRALDNVETKNPITTPAEPFKTL
jgi:hypothetical protein